MEEVDIDEIDEAAVQALDDAWQALPGDRTLRRARLRRGLPVAIPPTDKE